MPDEKIDELKNTIRISVEAVRALDKEQFRREVHGMLQRIENRFMQDWDELHRENPA
jgi:hypothetical protein